jgi:hypothetical protein
MADIPQPPLGANSGLMQRSKTAHHSITSSARTSSEGRTAIKAERFGGFEVDQQQHFGWKLHRSLGAMPRKILSTK